MWITDVWQYAPSFGAILAVVLMIGAWPLARIGRSWIEKRPDHVRALNERYVAETDRRVRMAELELRAREIELAARLTEIGFRLREGSSIEMSKLPFKSSAGSGPSADKSAKKAA